MAHCAGNVADHCCYLDGGPCQFLEQNTVPGRRWACGLYRQLGSWEAVSDDAGWREHVRPTVERLGLASCGEWPRPGETCATCGVTGDG